MIRWIRKAKCPQSDDNKSKIMKGENNEVETVYDTKEFEEVFFRNDGNDHIDFSTECNQSKSFDEQDNGENS